MRESEDKAKLEGEKMETIKSGSEEEEMMRKRDDC